MIRNIYLHGALAEKYGPVHRLSVETAGEAVRALSVNFKTFLSDIRDGAWHVVRGDDIDTGFSLGEEEIPSFRLGQGDLHIVPHVAGSKRGGVLKIILGAVLVGAAFLFSGGALATPILGGGGLLGGITYGNLAVIGLGLALSGVSQLLAPEASDDKKNQSYMFAGPGNTYDQGMPVPLVYGEVITGGALVSSGLDVEQL